MTFKWNRNTTHKDLHGMLQALAGEYDLKECMENANLICFFASDEASYISGQNLQIDGCRKKI